METFIAHNVVSPYRELVLREFQRHRMGQRGQIRRACRIIGQRLLQLPRAGMGG